MSAAATNRDGQWQLSEFVPYTGCSGYNIFKDTMIMTSGDGTGVIPVVQGAGASGSHFIGVANTQVNLTAGLGTSQRTLETFKKGEYTFEANGTGASSHIGQRAWALDDQTVGVSIEPPCLHVGEIVAIPTSSSYRVRIDNAIGGLADLAFGLSLLYSNDQN